MDVVLFEESESVCLCVYGGHGENKVMSKW